LLVCAQGDTLIGRGRMVWTSKAAERTAETPKVDFRRFRDGTTVEFY
jgi:hypothetical protein